MWTASRLAAQITWDKVTLGRWYCGDVVINNSPKTKKRGVTNDKEDCRFCFIEHVEETRFRSTCGAGGCIRCRCIFCSTHFWIPVIWMIQILTPKSKPSWIRLQSRTVLFFAPYTSVPQPNAKVHNSTRTEALVFVNVAYPNSNGSSQSMLVC